MLLDVYPDMFFLNILNGCCGTSFLQMHIESGSKRVLRR
jgi:methionine synthase I (cobalamin-dependent)